MFEGDLRNDPRSWTLNGQIPQAMTRTLHYMLDRLERFERWFDRRFGWFFTNGMKARTGQR